MKHVIRKAFFDYEKEEKWLNEMSAKGLALTDYSWCRYVFEDAPANEYIYRIELLENLATHPESKAYIRFLEESGIECVSYYSRWIYLRKKASEGSFDIYSDIESKIRFYKRISAFWNTLMLSELIIGLSNIIIGITDSNMQFSAGNISPLNIILGGLITVVGLFFFKLGIPIREKIRKLQRENAIRE